MCFFSTLRRSATSAALALSLTALLGGAAQAQIELDPGVALQLFTANSNDGYTSGRGTVFTVNAPFLLTSAGLWTNPGGSITYNWNLFQTTTYPGGVNNILLASNSITPADTGLGFYDVAIGPVPLAPGNRYHIQVDYSGAGEQNFFYNFHLGSVNLGIVTVEDGTNGGDTGNTVMPLIRLNGPGGGGAGAPEPGTLALLALGVVSGVAARRKK